MIISYDHVYDCFTGQVFPPRNRTPPAERKPRTAPNPKPSTKEERQPAEPTQGPNTNHEPTSTPRTPQSNRNQRRGWYPPQADLRLIPSTRPSPNRRQNRTQPDPPTVLDNPRSRRFWPTPPHGLHCLNSAGRLLLHGKCTDQTCFAPTPSWLTWTLSRQTGVYRKDAPRRRKRRHENLTLKGH